MSRVDADNREIGRELQKLEKLAGEGGAWLHPDLIIRCRDGDLSIEMEGEDPPRERIIQLPKEVLLPVDKMEITVRDGRFDLNIPHPGDLSPIQHKLAESMIALYNMTGKAEFQKRHCFWLAMAPHAGLADFILNEGRSMHQNQAGWRDAARKKLQGRALDDFIGETFLKSRVLGYHDTDEKASVNVIMPVVDFLNHHWRGSRFLTRPVGSQNALTVFRSRAVKGSRECFAFYSVMDALDSYIKYDFVDAAAPIVRSVPLDIRIPEVGTVNVMGRMGIVNKKKLGKQIEDLRLFMPALSQGPDKTRMRASHLLIPTEGSPLALRRVLNVIISRLANRHFAYDERRKIVREAERYVLEKNFEFYDELIRRTKKEIRDKGKSEVLTCILDLAALQKKKIENYKPMPEDKKLFYAAGNP